MIRMLIIGWMAFGLFYGWSQLPPSVAEVKESRQAACKGRGRPITVDDVVVACSDDPKTWSVWVPDGSYKDVRLVPLSEKTQEWMDAP